MKAAVVVANEDVQYLEIPEPEVKPGYVKIKVHYSGICGSDIPRVLHNGVHFYPIVLGHEFSGDVVEIGEGVTKVKAGDRVSGAPLVPCMKCEDCQKGNYSLCKHYSFIGSREQGSNADYVVVPEQNAVPFDASVPYEQGAMFEPSTVALHDFCRMIIREVSAWQSLAAEPLVCLPCSGQRSSAPKRLWFLISAMSVWSWQNALGQTRW